MIGLRSTGGRFGSWLLVVFLSFFSLLLTSPLHAEGGSGASPIVAPTVSAKDAPDPRANPVLSDIMNYGARIFYMGRLDGADSWFIYKNRQIQFAYTFGNSQNALIGVMFGPGGKGVTAQQLDTLINTNPEVSSLMKAATTNASLPEGKAALSDPAASAMLGGEDSQSQMGKLPMGSLEKSASAAAPLGSPGERLFAELLKASGVELGADTAPMVVMVMSPGCSHCKSSWRSLRDAVHSGKLRVRLVPVGATTEDEILGARLLHVADPLTVWDKYVGTALGGDKSQLSGEVDDSSRKAVKDNYALADSWSIRDTPYFVYRGKNNKIKVLRGEPEKVAAFLEDVAAP